MAGRKKVLGTVLALIGLPVVLALAEGVAYRVANRNNGTIVSSGERREYLLYVPRTHDPTKPTPLVISLHGAGMWPVSQRETSQWNRVAEKNGFIVVYPSGTEGSGPRFWRVNPASLGKDVKFISDVIDTVNAAYNIDLTRVYANGFSNGGGMSFVLSCTLSNRIAAVGMVGAAQMTPWSFCTDRRPVPMIAFHGTADGPAPYNGGVSWVVPRPLPAFRAWTTNWAQRNQCEPKPVESVVAADVTRLEYTNCADNAAVELYTILGGGHTWPGGGPLPEWFLGTTSYGIDASKLMWEFFREHPLRVTQTAARRN